MTVAPSDAQPVGASAAPGWLLGGSVLLSLAIHENDGFYSPLALALALGAFAFLMLGVLSLGRSGTAPHVVGERQLVAALVGLLLVGTSKVPGYWLHDLTIAAWAKGWSVALAAIAAGTYLFLPDGRASRLVFWSGVGGAVALRLWLLEASPSPFIDVFELAQQGSGYLLKGWNPYSSPVWATWHQGEIYTFAGYAYPPGGLIGQTCSFALTGDVRHANFAGEMLFAAALWQLGGHLKRAVRQLIVLLFLYQPKSLFVLENAWTEPLILGLFGVALCAHKKGRFSVAAGVLGFVLGMKHYLAFIVPQYLVAERRPRAWLVLFAVGALSVLPFVVADPVAFWRNGLLLVVSLPFSDQTLGLVSPIYKQTGWQPGPVLSVVVGLTSAALFPWLLSRVQPLARFTLATVCTLFCTFLFGTKAFCNYYYLVSGLWLAALVLCVSGGDSPSPATGRAVT